MDNYTSHFEKYLDKNLYVMPCARKGSTLPIHTAAESYDDLDKLESIAKRNVKLHGHCNIGLLCGKLTNIIAVDVDSEDRDFQKIITNILPPTPSGKIGNKSRGRTAFYRYGNIPTRRLKPQWSKNAIVEILSDGALTIMPPSDHPDHGYKYEWLGESLLDIDIDDLPILTIEHVDQIQRVIDGYYGVDETKTYVDTKNLQKTGRNSQLKSMVAAKIGESIPFDQMVDEIYNYDQTNHSPPLFSDPSERPISPNPLTNAYHFVASNFKSTRDKKYSPVARVVVQTLDDEIKEATKELLNYKDKKLPYLRGIGQEIFQHIYTYSNVPRTQFAYASSLASLSILLGNVYQYYGIAPNLFIMIVAPTGYGKDYPLNFPKKLLRDCGLSKYIGLSDPKSDAIISRTLTSKPMRIDTVDEASKLIGKMGDKNSQMNSANDIYSELYTAAAKGHFEGSHLVSQITPKNPEGKVGACDNPYITLFSAMTIQAFRGSMSSTLMQTGFGNRNLYFADEEFKDVIRPCIELPIPRDIITFAKTINQTRDQQKLDLRSNHLPQIKSTKKIDDALFEIGRSYHRESQNDVMDYNVKALYQRANYILTKMMLIDHLACENDTVKMESVHFAQEFMETYLHNSSILISNNISNSKTEAILKVLHSVIKKYKQLSANELSKIYSVKELGLTVKQKNEYLQTLESESKIEIISIPTKGKTKKIYKVAE